MSSFTSQPPYPRGKCPHCQLHRDSVSLRASMDTEKYKDIFPLMRIEPHSIQYVARPYIDSAILVY
jgi:hypothetical protein